MWAYLNRDIAEGSSSTLIIDDLDCRPMILILSRVNMAFAIPHLFFSSYSNWLAIFLPKNFPKVTQLDPQSLVNTKAQRVSGKQRSRRAWNTTGDEKTSLALIIE